MERPSVNSTTVPDATEVDATVREVLSLVIGRPVPAGVDLRRDDEPAWDSLRHIELVLALESALDVRFGTDQIPELDSVSAIVALVLDGAHET